MFFAVGLNSSKRMSHQIRRNSNSVSSSPTHPQAKVWIKFYNNKYYYYYFDSIYLWMPYKKQAKPGAASVTQGP